MLIAALRRLAVLTLTAIAVSVVGSLLIGLLIGSSPRRSIVLGFYLVGSFLLIAGFFVGNRGPARVKSEGAAPSVFPIPGMGGARQLRWATLGEQHEAINNSAVYVALGLVLVALGVLLDSHESLF